MYDAREHLMREGRRYIDMWMTQVGVGICGLAGEAFAKAVVSCEVNRQWRKGTNPVAMSHM